MAELKRSKPVKHPAASHCLLIHRLVEVIKAKLSKPEDNVSSYIKVSRRKNLNVLP